MKTKLTFSGSNIYFSGSLITVIIGVILFLSGCSPTVELDPEIQRMKDSISVYSTLNTAYTKYNEALKACQGDQKSSALKSFEQSVELVLSLDSKILDNPRNTQWKNDYNEIGKSIVQDYLASQLDVEEKSKVFILANKLAIKYEKVNVFTNSDTEPLPSGSDLPLIRNNYVDEYIDFFSKTDRGRGFIDKTLYRSGKYFPLMRKIIRYHNAPEELIYLSVVESGLSPTIISKAGATGLWQFMTATGQAYGLYQDSYRDDRRDFEKSTDAASRHLKDLFRSFNDWYLAFASYNAGPGRVTSAMNKSSSKDFWSIRGYLPGETKNYVPTILAVSFIFRNPEDYGFKNVDYAKPLTFDRADIKGNLTFEQIAKYTETDIETIRDLNPELLQDALPTYDVAYQLRIPRGSYETFRSNYKKSLEYEKNGEFEPEFAGNEEGLYAEEPIGSYYKVEDYNPGDAKYIVSTENKKKISYIFKPADNLKIVSDSFKVRTIDIRTWNHIPIGGIPKAGQELSIYLSESAYNQLYGIPDKKIDSTEIENKIPENNINKDDSKKENNNNEKVKENGNATEKKKKTKPKEKEQSYSVKEGDSLGKIAELYGVKIQDIKDWNGLKDDKILVGQKLKIYSDKKTEKTEKNTKAKTHTVKEGENLSVIADKYDVKVSELMEWNELENDVIKTNQVLIVSEPAKKETKEKTKKTSTKAKTHKVEEGENLTTIADKYDVTVNNLMDWNELESDKLLVGQVLNISDPGKTKTKEKTSEKTKEKSSDKTKEKTTGKTKIIIYQVKKGDNLQTIADEFEVTIADIKKWNSLKGDKIEIGQDLEIHVIDTKKK